ncbi:MAG: hypothetical protein KDH88_18440 [Chromatiales bacterium]|nr:hypothetical protein [Chromatiales bacterium]
MFPKSIDYHSPHWRLILFVLLVCSVPVAVALDGQSQIAPKARESLLLDLSAVPGLMVAVGERGHVLISNDGGQNWTQSASPTRATLTAVFAHDPRLIWAVGHDAVILRSSDGGLNWRKVYSAPEEQRPLLDVWFADARHGFAIGAYGYFLETRDGGDTWESRFISEDDFHLNHLARGDDGTLYIAAERGNFYRSGDGGENWEALTTPYEGSYFGTLPLDGEQLLLFGLRGHLFGSADRGDTWSEIPNDSKAMLTCALRLDDGSILIGGLAGTILLSRDSGSSWQLLQQKDRKGISSMVVAGERLIVVGEGGVRSLSLPELLSGEG